MANPKPVKLPKWSTNETPIPTWATATAYALDVMVRNGTHIYTCIAAGNSAASGGGPTGTGASIHDGSGTLYWEYTGEATAQPKVEPSGYKKIVGWLFGESPPGNIFNWLFNNIYTWCQYLDTFTQATQTWTGTQTFTNLVLNGFLSLFEAPLAGINLIGSLTLNSYTQRVRIYHTGADFVSGSSPLGGGFLLTMNASWDSGNSKFVPDNTGVGYAMVFVQFTAPLIAMYTAGPSGSGWTTLNTSVRIGPNRGLEIAQGTTSGMATTISGSPTIFVTVPATALSSGTSLVFAMMQGGSVDSGFQHVIRAYWYSSTQIAIEGVGNATTTGAKVAWWVLNAPN